MNIELKDLENCKKEIEGVLTYDELMPHFEKAYSQYRQKITIPGFRKGKAPLNMVKKMYGDSIEYSALDKIIEDIFSKYIIDNKIDLVDRGSITDIDYKPKEKLTFKVEFEVKPEITLENYRGLNLTKLKFVIDDSVVEEEIKYHRLRLSTLELDGVASDEEYMITLDLQNLDEKGNILIGETQKDVKIYLNNPELLPEFKQGLQGIKEGEDRIINFNDKEGKIKSVKIQCKKVEKVVQPELNEEFFKRVTGKDDIKTEEEFRNLVKSELQKIYDDNAAQKLKNDVINEMIKLNDIPVPERYIEIYLDSFVEDYKNRMPKRELPKDFDVNEFKKQRRVDAIVQSKWYLMREKLIENEKIEVSNEDIKKLAEDNSVKYNLPLDKLTSIYEKNEDIRLNILNNKVLDFLIENANITEKEEVISPNVEHQHEHSH